MDIPIKCESGGSGGGPSSGKEILFDAEKRESAELRGFLQA